MTDEPEFCRNCRFWAALGRGGQGRCRRSHPVVLLVPEEGVVSQFPRTDECQWCGEYEPTTAKVIAEAQAYRIGAEAERLLAAATFAAQLELTDPEDEWRSPLAILSARISREVPHLDRAIRDKAKTDAKDKAVIDLLNWAALDTALAEATAQ